MSKTFDDKQAFADEAVRLAEGAFLRERRAPIAAPAPALICAPTPAPAPASAPAPAPALALADEAQAFAVAKRARSPAARTAAPRLGPLVAQARADSPLGGILLAATAQGLAGLWFDDQKYHPGPFNAPTDATHPWIARALEELDAYWHRGGSTFTVPLDAQGSTFQRQVWRALREIGRGRTLGYGALAAQLGRASAVRAVAAAVGRNPLSVIVPCHRVIGAGGALTGYAGGLDRKRALLRLEGVAV